MTNKRFEMSVVIPTHNKPDDLVRCVAAILEMPFEHGTYEIVIVDDGSHEAVEPRLEPLHKGDIPINCIRLEGKGPACARNAGIAASRGDIVALCDDDAIPQPGYLNAIYKPFNNGPGVVGVEGAVIPVGGEKYGLLGMSPKNDKGGVFLTCNIAFRRSVLLEVGGLDETFPYPAFEDCDLASAIKPLGQIVWAPGASVQHPRRRWSLSRAIREIKFYEPLVLFARRYGYLGWEDRPTQMPWARVYWSAVVALPLGRMKKGLLGIFSSHPMRALEYFMVSGIQGLLASVLVVPAICRGYGKEKNRRKHVVED